MAARSLEVSLIGLPLVFLDLVALRADSSRAELEQGDQREPSMAEAESIRTWFESNDLDRWSETW